MHRIIVLLGVLILSVNALNACQCEMLPPLSRSMVEKYDVVFMGRVLAVSDNGVESKAHFIITEVYRGGLYKEVDVQFDAESDCGMSFVPGESWMIYGNWIKVGLPVTSMCTHSRKFSAAGESDFYITQGRGTWDAEKKFLTDTIGVQKFLDPADHKDFGHKNIIPSGMQALLYLGFGLGGLAIIFLVVKRIFRNDAK